MDPAAAPAPAAPDSPLADTVLARLTELYAPAADPVRAEGAAAYMKHIAPFLGIPTPRRRALSKAVLAGTERPDERDCTAIALRCWGLPEREYQYFAVDYLRRYVASCSSGFLPVLHHLVTTTPWWDTVDLLAAHVAGPLVSADPALARAMDRMDRRLRTCGPPGPPCCTSSATKDATDTGTGSSATACAARTTRTSSSARRSAGRCGSTRRPIPPPYATSSRAPGTTCHRCRCARRSRTSEARGSWRTS
ncbi:hypothetical protein SCYAM73S_03204 [Streptomyces cyaneofuscatus]